MPQLVPPDDIFQQGGEGEGGEKEYLCLFRSSYLGGLSVGSSAVDKVDGRVK